MAKKKPLLVCASDSFSRKELVGLQGMDRFEVKVAESPDRGWLEKHLPSADAYLATLRIPLDRDLVSRARSLKVVGTNTTGTDHLDLVALAERGVQVLSLKNDLSFLRGITPTAELAFGLLIACARRFRECSESSREGHWGRHDMAGLLLKGKTLGIVGLGRLGTMVAGYAKAFHMRVVACDPGPHRSPAHVERLPMDKLLRESDFLSLHVHLADETHHLIGPKEFARMKKGVVLINTSRGGLVDEKALVKAMETGRVAAAGLDVIDGEWQEDKYNHPLIAYSRKNPNLLITPHVGGTCPEAIRASMQHTVSKMAIFFDRPHQKSSANGRRKERKSL